LWNDRLRLLEDVEKDWLLLPDELRKAARIALEKIDDDPIAGAPLFDPFRGWWSYRSGRLRVIYTIAHEARFVVVARISDAGEEKAALT
jgi:mRNA-degrading endonuclease RelE of RelBE toxin-antitoxin system